MEPAAAGNLLRQRLQEPRRDHRDPVLASLAVADSQFTLREIRVLDSQFRALEQPEPGATEQPAEPPPVS